MRKFKFRLDTVLKFREACESDAKKSLQNKRHEITSVLLEIDKNEQERKNLYLNRPNSISAFQSREVHRFRLDDDDRSHRVALSILRQEEEKLQADYLKSRLELKTLTILKESDLADWKKQYLNWETKQIDAWTVSSRSQEIHI